MTENRTLLSGTGISRRNLLIGAGTAAAITGFPGILRAADDIKVGFCTAMTGLQTILGETQLNCFKLAVDQINAAGGVGGRRLSYVVEDNATTTRGSIEKTRKLLFQDNVEAIIGMITSLERQAALTVSASAKKLLIYPTYYEGGECNPYLICTGQIPNQAVAPFYPWLMKNVGKSVYILGSDYVWPQKTADEIATAATFSGGEVKGKEFFPFGTTDFGPVLERVRAANPDMVWCLFAGADAVSFIKQYSGYGLSAKLVSNGIDEIFTAGLSGSEVEGIIVNQSYFSALQTPASQTFVESYRTAFGANTVVNAIGESTYAGVWLYAKAVEAAGSTETEKVIAAIREARFEAPEGEVHIDPSNNHMHTASIVGRCRADTTFEIIENFGMIAPSVTGCAL
ncbi:substrate-binding protein [Ochrobactrum teleogrylli]|uniref:substrate-binding protein n=1 Tax=Ochrobactrum teleogrylli TaxID=2479765 RepID=UPI00384F7DDC